MKDIKIKNKRFIEKYEKEIKEYRDKYYKNIVTLNSNYSPSSPSLAFFLIPTFIAIIIVIKYNFSILSYIIALITIVILNFLFKLLSRILKFENQNKYLEEIRKQGYLNIDSYEKKLKKYVTGPGGYYETLLNKYIEEYNINENTRKIFGINGEEYYIWANQNQDKINLLNCKCKNKPEIKSIKFYNIRYFRVDNQKKMIILKTDVEEIYLTLNSLEVLNVLMKQKKYENINSFTPENYINDFEIYMHNLKKELNKNPKLTGEKLGENLTKIITITIIIGALIGIKYLLPAYKTQIDLISLIFIFFINSSIKELFEFKNTKLKTDKDYIEYLNKNPECIEKFEELKYSLGISNSYDRVYTNEGACYLTWVANGYFHVFLNIIYFHVVYMAINTSDVLYYRKTNKECLIKLKDKELSFKKDAAEVFAKILPNKDYDWLKGYQNKK